MEVIRPASLIHNLFNKGNEVTLTVFKLLLPKNSCSNKGLLVRSTEVYFPLRSAYFKTLSPEILIDGLDPQRVTKLRLVFWDKLTGAVILLYLIMSIVKFVKCSIPVISLIDKLFVRFIE